MTLTTNSEEQEILVRGSAEHKDYLRHQFGRIKETVNSFETRIAVAGRAMLLIYVVYITVKAGIGGSLPADMLPWVTTSLQLLDIVMLALQVLGLEGSVPGLRHLAEELEDKGKRKEAQTVRGASNVAQWLLVATAVDIVLQNTHHWGTWDMSSFAIAYANCLFVLRVLVIGLYLVAMAKLEHKGPKVISAHEAAKRQKDKEQEQIRLDNAAIQRSIDQTLNTWMRGQQQQQQARNDEALARWMAQQSQHMAAQFAALKQTNLTPALNVDDLSASIFASLQSHFDTQIEALKRENEAMERRQIEAAKHLIEAHIRAQSEAPRRSSEVSRHNADAPTTSRHATARPSAAPGLLCLPVNGDRAAQKAEALRLVDSGLSTYKAAEQTGIPSGTIQRWLKERKEALGRQVAVQGQSGGEAREA